MKNYLTISRDYDYLSRVAKLRPTTSQDIEDCWRADIKCSVEGGCGGWQECREDHTGFDPNDEDSVAYDEFEDVMIHGVSHVWRWGYDWTVPYEGCILEHGDFEVPDEIDKRRDGVYEVDDDWDDTDVWLTYVGEVTDDSNN